MCVCVLMAGSFFHGLLWATGGFPGSTGIATAWGEGNAGEGGNSSCPSKLREFSTVMVNL